MVKRLNHRLGTAWREEEEKKRPVLETGEGRSGGGAPGSNHDWLNRNRHRGYSQSCSATLSFNRESERLVVCTVVRGLVVRWGEGGGGPPESTPMILCQTPFISKLNEGETGTSKQTTAASP